MPVTITHYSDEQLRALLPFPAGDANKYTRGEALVAGGSNRYPGAMCLAAHAASKMGAGYVNAFCGSQAMDIVRAYDPTLVVTSWKEFGSVIDGKLENPSDTHPCAALVGSGMEGDSGAEERLVCHALDKANVPLVIDGAGIGYLASGTGVRLAAARTAPLIVTPHYGEAARLARGIRRTDFFETANAEANLAAFAKVLADGYRATVVLKGPVTYIADSATDEVVEMSCGTSILAKAGTGDVLAGMTVALLAQGLQPVQAGVLASTLHALSAAWAARDLTPICVDAADVITYLPAAIKQLLPAQPKPGGAGAPLRQV